jgi:RimJ/RimL family protein N-acetyltransferase
MQDRRQRGTLCRVEDAPLAAEGSRFTRRLRLEAVGPANAGDLWLVHNDDDVWPWYGDEKPGLEQARQQAAFMGESWRLHGVHKWIAYDRVSGEVVGRGGLSRTPVNDDWGQVYALLPAGPWVRVAHEICRPFTAHANWLEIGWAVRRGFWGHGYASEIGRAGLEFAFGVLGVEAVVSCTARHNVRSRAVMERSGCGTRARSAAAAWLKGSKESRTTRRSPCACCCEKTGCPVSIILASGSPREEGFCHVY